MKRTDRSWGLSVALLVLSVLALAACGTDSPRPGLGDEPPSVQVTAPAPTPTQQAPVVSSPPTQQGRVVQEQPEPTAGTPAATAAPVQAPPAVAEPGPAPASTPTLMATGWRTGPPLGGAVGETAVNTQVTLAGGTRAPLEELAGGKPLLLYFFATW